MSVSTWVDGDPVGCRASSTELATLQSRIRSLADALAECRSVASGAWSGRAAEAFDTAARSRLTKVDALADLVGALGSGLAGLADTLDALGRQMGLAHAIAAGAAIPTGANWIAGRGDFRATPEQEVPHADALALVHSVRLREAEVHEEWATSLGALLGFNWEPTRAPGRAAAPASAFDRWGIPGLRTLDEFLPDLPAIKRPELPDIDLPSVDLPSKADWKNAAVWTLTRPAELPDLPLHLRYPGGVQEAKEWSEDFSHQLEQDAAAGEENLLATIGRTQLRFTLSTGGGALGALRCLPKTPLQIRRTITCQEKGEEAGDAFADALLEKIDGRK